MQTKEEPTMQYGGRLLGVGVHGCTFDPAPRCAGGSVFRKVQGLPAVGKLTNDFVDEELAIGRSLMRNPLGAQYFAVPTQQCTPVLPISDRDADDCTVLKEEEVGPFSVLAMPYAGTELLKWIPKNPLRAAENYERIFVHLLEGILVYQEKGIVHNDIHMGNIMVDDMGVARFIDFGLAYYAKDAVDLETANLGSRFRPQYVFQAPEIHAWRMMINKIPLIDGVRQLYDVNPEYARMEHQFPKRLPALAALEGLMNHNEAFRSENFEAFLRAFWNKIDAWRIGLCMWLLWDDLLHWPWIKKTALWERRDVIRRTLEGLTDFDVRNRLTVADALRILDPKNRMVSSVVSSASMGSA
jgi:serine/threonine protein kinase